MKRLFLLGGVLFAFSVVNVNAQSATSTTTSVQNVDNNTSSSSITSLPDYPVYVNTGNPTQDALTHKQAKEKWVSENKDLYDAELQKLNANYKDEEVNQEEVDKLNKQSDELDPKNNSK